MALHDVEPASPQPASSSDEGSSGSDAEPVMAVSRVRRSNAGNRMAQLLQLADAEDQQAEEDGYAAIFQETLDDHEFEGDEDGDADGYLSSSSEDDDQEGEDEEQGEKELRKEEQQQGHGKKRKKPSLLQQTMKLKRMKFAPGLDQKAIPAGPGTATTAPKPKKKVDRILWLPEASAIRSSTRRLAIENKEATHVRLKEQAKRREKTLAMMQAAEERKKANEHRPMTQEERLAHAAEVERENTTSVNRWEEVENQRVEERKARLAALKNRKLEGPVVTYWSGPAVWINDKLRYVGKKSLVEEVEPQPKKKPTKRSSVENGHVVYAPAETDAGTVEPITDTLDASLAQSQDGQAQKAPASGTETDADVTAGASPSLPSSEMEIDSKPMETPTASTQPQQSASNGDFLEGIEYWASLPAEVGKPGPQYPPIAILGAPAERRETLADILSASSSARAMPMSIPSTTYASTSHAAPLPPLPHVIPMEVDSTPITPAEPAVEPPAIQVTAARTLITLTSFAKLDNRSRRAEREREIEEDNQTTGRWGGARVSAAEKDRELLLRILFTVPPAPPVESIIPILSNFTVSDSTLDPEGSPFKEDLRTYDPLVPSSSHPRHNTRYLTKRAAQCAITGHTARYRDPMTRLPYVSSRAYRSIRSVANGNGMWSDKFQCWVGESRPAKGVPESVWSGKAAEQKDSKEQEKTNKANEVKAAAKSIATTT